MPDDLSHFGFLAFRYPLFHLDIVVLAGIAACFCLLAIWAGLSARHWFWRAGAIVLSILALPPIQAHQPALMLAAALPAISLTIAALNRRGIGPRRSTDDLKPLRLRFGLQDLLLAILLAGAVFYCVTILIDRRDDLDWKLAATGATSMVLLATLCYAVVFAPRRRLLLVCAILLSITLNALLVTLTDRGLAIEVVEVQALQDFMLDMVPDDGFRIEKFTCLTLAGAEYCLLLSALLVILFARRVPTVGRKSTRLLRAAAGAAAAALVGAMSILYWHMLQGSSLRQHDPSDPNCYPRLLEIAEQVQLRNPSQVALQELAASDDSDSREKIAELQSLYAEGHRLATQKGYVPPEVLRKYFREFGFTDIVLFRDLAKAWRAEGEWLAKQGRYDEAADYHVAAIEIGTNALREGVVLHELGENGCEGIGIYSLGRIRSRVSPPRVGSLLATLGEIDASREPLDAIAARDLESVRDSGAWRSRCAHAIAAWFDRDLGSADLLVFSRRARDVELRLLMADLAVRLYHHEQQRLPEQLSDLIPKYLAAVPIDPYSGQPLVYRPEGESFLLYSVGQDGRDDGGRIRPDEESLLTPGYDQLLAPVDTSR